MDPISVADCTNGAAGVATSWAMMISSQFCHNSRIGLWSSGRVKLVKGAVGQKVDLVAAWGGKRARER